MANTKKYDGLSTSQLAQITRDRGLQKPEVTDAGQWAAWLREQDSKPTLPQPIAAPVGYEAMTVRDLRALAEERGIDHSGARTKTEVIDLLKGAE